MTCTHIKYIICVFNKCLLVYLCLNTKSYNTYIIMLTYNTNMSYMCITLVYRLYTIVYKLHITTF